MGWRRRLALLSLVVNVVMSALVGLPSVTEAASEPLLAGEAGPRPLPAGPVVKLDVAGALAVGPTGALYVAAPFQHRIVVRLADGRYRVVAGDGEKGFSGDGGQAVDAELTSPRDLTFGPAGSLYFLDGGRVRVVGTNGLVRTVAGNEAHSTGVPGSSSPPVADGTPALSASLGSSPSIALSPTGQLYVDTANQLLRLSSGGRLQTVRTHQVSFTGPTGLPGTLDINLGSLGVDSAGNLDVAGFNGWGIWRVAHDGTATYLGYARGSGGQAPDLVRGSSGAVYAADGSNIMRLGRTKLVAAYDLNVTVHSEYFWLTSFAFGPGGVIYADELPGNGGFERHQQLISFTAGHVQLLWQEGQQGGGSAG